MPTSILQQVFIQQLIIITGEIIPGNLDIRDLKEKYQNNSLLKNVIKDSKFIMLENFLKLILQVKKCLYKKFILKYVIKQLLLKNLIWKLQKNSANKNSF